MTRDNVTARGPYGEISEFSHTWFGVAQLALECQIWTALHREVYSEGSFIPNPRLIYGYSRT